MKLLHLLPALFCAAEAAVPRQKRQDSSPGYGFEHGEPQSSSGKGAPILGGTNPEVDIANQANLGEESTDNGVVPNLKWRFSDSRTRLLPGGWVREQVITDLPVSTDIAAAQQHLQKGAIRELHWHRVAEWGFLYAGRILISAVDADGRYQVSELNPGDVWYFPKGIAHVIQGLDDENEYLLAFDDGDFDKVGTTFMVDDWILHTPLNIVLQNFGVNETVFENLPETDPYILNATISDAAVSAPENEALTGNNSYVYVARDNAAEAVPGGGGTFRVVDSTTFPISTTIAAAFVTLEPGGLRELHWHPNAQEWLYFHAGTARASVFMGGGIARTFDFSAGDTAVFPDNSGHYIVNTSPTETLEWVEIYKSDKVQDISLSQWLALTPSGVVQSVMNVSAEFVAGLKKEKQLLLKGTGDLNASEAFPP
ncbi:hypothetical protein LTR09_005301 [Extremus antarcticus]|uniref:Cupin type-1 domain-containing protein n=1 Tax=Extremus antarcticus TaxID=702011 RepID=A0AAJ0DGM3_9PEZI|nr:hypothetical protein LTR09_005301 [Extremus antarcticus]